MAFFVNGFNNAVNDLKGAFAKKPSKSNEKATAEAASGASPQRPSLESLAINFKLKNQGVVQEYATQIQTARDAASESSSSIRNSGEFQVFVSNLQSQTQVLKTDLRLSHNQNEANVYNSSYFTKELEEFQNSLAQNRYTLVDAAGKEDIAELLGQMKEIEGFFKTLEDAPKIVEYADSFTQSLKKINDCETGLEGSTLQSAVDQLKNTQKEIDGEVNVHFSSGRNRAVDNFFKNLEKKQILPENSELKKTLFDAKLDQINLRTQNMGTLIQAFEHTKAAFETGDFSGLQVNDLELVSEVLGTKELQKMVEEKLAALTDPSKGDRTPAEEYRDNLGAFLKKCTGSSTLAEFNKSPFKKGLGQQIIDFFVWLFAKLSSCSSNAQDGYRPIVEENDRSRDQSAEPSQVATTHQDSSGYLRLSSEEDSSQIRSLNESSEASQLEREAAPQIGPSELQASLAAPVQEPAQSVLVSAEPEAQNPVSAAFHAAPESEVESAEDREYLNSILNREEEAVWDKKLRDFRNGIITCPTVESLIPVCETLAKAAEDLDALPVSVKRNYAVNYVKEAARSAQKQFDYLKEMGSFADESSLALCELTIGKIKTFPDFI